MRHRLDIGVFLMLLLLAGCLADADGIESADTTNATNVSLAAGEDIDIELRFENISTLHIDYPERQGLDHREIVAYSKARLEPTPKVRWDGDPPSWMWPTNESVRAVIPVRTERNTRSGLYRFTVVGEGDEVQRKLIRVRITE